MLTALRGFDGGAHVCFASPKVGGSTAEALEEVFETLRGTYREVDWRLAINGSFRSEILEPTLAANASTSDTTELFVRAVRLLGIGQA